jgi:hypothetical protein
MAIWAAATDLDPLRQGPAAALRIGGSAKAVVREIPIAMLTNGAPLVDAQGQVVRNRTGVEMLVNILSRRYAPLQQEQQIHSVSEVMNFRKERSESTDECIARFEILVNRAEQIAGIALPEVVLAWMLLTTLGTPLSQWPTVLAQTQGMLPADAAQLNDFKLYLRRNAHLFEHGRDSQATLHQPFMANHVQNPSGDSFAQSASWQPWNQQLQQNHANLNQTTVPGGFMSMPAMPDGSNSYPTPTYPAAAAAASDDQDEWETASSGMSNPEEPVDLNDLLELPTQLADENAYLHYRHHKRRWRKWNGGHPT